MSTDRSQDEFAILARTNLEQLGAPMRIMNAKKLTIVSAALLGLMLTMPFMASAAEQKIGMFYLIWHCPASASQKYRPSGNIFDNSQILAGKGDWGPLHAFHWWGKPDAGYYCLAENDELLKQHAEMLRDAGIDFVFVDITNQDNQKGAKATIIAPFERMIDVWSKIPRAPKIVPWVRITDDGDMVDFIDKKMAEFPQMAFNYRGKPLLLANAPRSDAHSKRLADLKTRYTVRMMWGLQKPQRLQAGEWSFLQPCVPEFKNARGNGPCQQCFSYFNNKPEQISVTAAYQYDFMSNTDPKSPSSAVPKYHGKTLIRQLQTAYQHPEIPIVTITGWNEWIAQRHLNLQKQEEFPNGNKVFTDAYNVEYNRDIEPGGGMGDYYYALLKRGIQLLKEGKDPIVALPENLRKPASAVQ